MKLLDRYDRKPRRPDSRFSPGGRRQAHTFDDAIELLGRKLRNLGVPILPPLEGWYGKEEDDPAEEDPSPPA